VYQKNFVYGETVMEESVQQPTNIQPYVNLTLSEQQIEHFGDGNKDTVTNINEFLDAFAKSNGTLLLGSIDIKRKDISYCIHDGNNFYTAHFIDLLLYPISQNDTNIKVYRAITAEQLKEYDLEIRSQKQNYAFIPLNVAHEQNVQHENHWAALIIDQQNKSMFYLDPASNKILPKSIELLHTQLNGLPIILNPIDFQQQEEGESWFRHCGAYVIEIFDIFHKYIQKKQCITGSQLADINADPNSISLQQALKGIRRRLAKNITGIRALHINKAHEVLLNYCSFDVLDKTNILESDNNEKTNEKPHSQEKQKYFHDSNYATQPREPNFANDDVTLLRPEQGVIASNLFPQYIKKFFEQYSGIEISTEIYQEALCVAQQNRGGQGRGIFPAPIPTGDSFLGIFHRDSGNLPYYRERGYDLLLMPPNHVITKKDIPIETIVLQQEEMGISAYFINKQAELEKRFLWLPQAEGYQFCPLSKLNDNPKNAVAGEFYLSADGRYCVRDLAGFIQQGFLGQDLNITAENLPNKLNQSSFKKSVLKITSERGHTVPELPFPAGYIVILQSCPKDNKARKHRFYLSSDKGDGVEDGVYYSVVSPQDKFLINEKIEIEFLKTQLGNANFEQLMAALKRRNKGELKPFLETIFKITEERGHTKKQGVPVSITKEKNEDLYRDLIHKIELTCDATELGKFSTASDFCKEVVSIILKFEINYLYHVDPATLNNLSLSQVWHALNYILLCLKRLCVGVAKSPDDRDLRSFIDELIKNLDKIKDYEALIKPLKNLIDRCEKKKIKVRHHFLITNKDEFQDSLFIDSERHVQQVQVLQLECTKLRADRDQFETETHNLRLKAEHSKIREEALVDEKSQLSSGLSDKHEKYVQLLKEREEFLLPTIRNLENKAEGLEKQLKESLDKEKNLYIEIQQLTEEKLITDTKMQQLSLNFENLQTERDKLYSEAQNTKLDYDDLKLQWNSLNTKATKLSTDSGKYQAIIQRYQVQNRISAETIKQLQNKVAELEREHGLAIDNREERENPNADFILLQYQEENQTLKKTVQELQARIAQLERERAEQPGQETNYSFRFFNLNT